jgi:hypothetical protein
MRKGLVITLGVVALGLVVSPSFAVAPIISCVPDIIVSDFEQSQTVDNNLFIFSNALDLDEYVQDADTTDSALLRWSFIQSVGPALELNGIASNPGVNILAPGADDIRAVSNMLTVRNVDWSPADLANPDPTGSPADSMLELYVSDGTNTGSQTVTVTSIDESAAGPGDRLVPVSSTSYPFAAGQESWTYFNDPALTTPVESWAAGSVQMVAPAGGTNVVFGAWESPKNPAVAESPRFGCILRGRFQVRSSADGQTVPGIRMRAVTTHVMDSGGGAWIPDFLSQDLNSDLTVNYFTPDFGYQANREPGIAGKTYDILSWPQQIDSLMSTSVITYFTCDILDLDKSFSDDSGTISIDQVDFDGVDRPAAGAGTAVPGLSTLTGWAGNVSPIDPAQLVAPVFNIGANGPVSLVCALGTQWYDAAALSPAVALDAGQYYRAIFTVSSTAVPGGTSIGPTFRLGFVSSAFAFSADKNLPGGGLLSAIGPTPEDFEVWMQAPPAAGAQTEPISVRFQSWLTTSNVGFPSNKNVFGTIDTTAVSVESFAPPATP